MLGFDAFVHEIRPGATDLDLLRVSEAFCEGRVADATDVVLRSIAHIPYRTWVDHLLAAVETGRVEMLRGDGYPYLFHAKGADVKINFAASEVEAISTLTDTSWYLIEAWDQT